MFVEHGDADALGHGAAEHAVHAVGEFLDAAAAQFGLFGQVEDDVAAVHVAIGRLFEVVERHHMRSTAALHRGQRLGQAGHRVAALVHRGDEHVGGVLRLGVGRLLGDAQRLVADGGRRRVGIGGELADHHAAQAMAEQFLELGHVLVGAGQDQAPGVAVAVELLGQFGHVLQVLARHALFAALVARRGPAAGLVLLDFLAQEPFHGLQHAHVEDVEPRALLVHVDDAVTLVRVQQRGQLAYVGPPPHHDAVLHGHGETVGPPETFGLATEHDDAAALPVVAHLHVILHALDVLGIGPLGLVQEIAQR